MPHIMSGMADYQRENRKAAAQRRKPLRKGSPTHNRGKGSMVCGSPPVRVFYRQDNYLDTQSDSAANVVETPLMENVNSMQDVCAGMSPPPKVNSNASTMSGAGIRHAPSPAFLPQPPKHWMGEADFEDQVLDICIDTGKDVGSAISNQLKMLLKVQG